MTLLEFTKWENFHQVIKRAMVACESSNYMVLEQFPLIRKLIKSGNGNIQYIIDYKMTIYTCYLILQNANPKKKLIALGQIYLAIQTRKQV